MRLDMEEVYMLVDYHVHSEFSDDSIYEMEQVVKDAISKGLSEICFTDHVDYGIKKDWDDPDGVEKRRGGPGEPDWMYLANVDYPKYVEKIHFLQEKYKDQITIKIGLEFGMQTYTIQKYEGLFSKYNFDFILLSIHQIEDKEFWTGDYQAGKTQKEYNEQYYDELYNLVCHYKNYSCLAHLDLIVRYDPCGAYPFEKVKPIITKILKQVIQDGKGIELNTSYHRYKLKDTQPSRDILKLYKELGGTIITIGSDSHKESHLGAYVDEAQDILKEIGFEYYCTFDRMKPIYHKL